MKGAFEIPNLRFTGIAAAEIPLHRFMAVDANGEYRLAGTADKVIGVSRNHVDMGQPIEVADGICIVEAAGVIAFGAKLEADGNGKAITATSGTVNGIALTNATAAGQFVAVKLV